MSTGWAGGVALFLLGSDTPFPLEALGRTASALGPDFSFFLSSLDSFRPLAPVQCPHLLADFVFEHHLPFADVIDRVGWHTMVVVGLHVFSSHA